MSKQKVSSKTDIKDTNSLEEEELKIDGETNDQQGNDDENKIEETFEDHKKEIQDLKDQLLRSLAEGENLEKRTIKEIADAKKYSHISFVRDLVSSVDNLQRALEGTT